MPTDLSPFVPLQPAAIVEIAGADALAFAHAQFTSDVAGLAEGAWQPSAWLGAQGRARAVFALLRPAHDTLLAFLPLGGGGEFRDALARYVLRANVRVRVREGWMLAQLLANEAELGERSLAAFDDGIAFALPGPEMRIAWLGDAALAEYDAEALESWRALDVAAQLPWLAPSLADEFVPQALGLDRIDAIRFDKGCYPGQEIAARLHFRGGNKRVLRRAKLVGDAPAPPGLRIVSGDDAVGTVLYSARVGESERDALAVLSDANVSDAALASSAGHVVTFP